MTANAIAISRNLADAGLDKKAADAIAEAVVTHSDENLATKADIARIETAVKLNMGLTIGLYIGIALLFVDKLVG